MRNRCNISGDKDHKTKVYKNGIVLKKEIAPEIDC